MKLGRKREEVIITDPAGVEHIGYLCRPSDLPISRALRLRVIMDGGSIDETNYVDLICLCIIGVDEQVIRDSLTAADIQTIMDAIGDEGEHDGDPTAAE